MLLDVRVTEEATYKMYNKYCGDVCYNDSSGWERQRSIYSTAVYCNNLNCGLLHKP